MSFPVLQPRWYVAPGGQSIVCMIDFFGYLVLKLYTITCFHGATSFKFAKDGTTKYD